MEKIENLCYNISLELFKQLIRDKKDLIVEYFKLFDDEGEEKYWLNYKEDFREFIFVLWLGDRPFPYSAIPKEKLTFLVEDIINFLNNWKN